MTDNSIILPFQIADTRSGFQQLENYYLNKLDDESRRSWAEYVNGLNISCKCCGSSDVKPYFAGDFVIIRCNSCSKREASPFNLVDELVNGWLL